MGNDRLALRPNTNGYPSTIIWDLDGTLVESAPDLTDALNTLLREHGYAGLKEDQVRTIIGDGVGRFIERGFKAAGAAISELQVQELIPRFMLIYSFCATNRSRLYPAARPILKHFSDAGVRQGICTNKPEGITRHILSVLSIGQHFDAVVGGDTTTEMKPAPLPLQTCLEALNASPQDSLLIGDSGVDVAAARAMNMVVGIVTYGYAREPIRNLGADFFVDRLSSLPKCISTLRNAR